MIRTLPAIVTFALISFTTFAQTVPPEFVTCSRIQKNGERLACYDRAVAYLSQSTERQSPAPSAEASFGLQAGAPQPSVTAEETKDEEISSIRARVSELSTDREGKKVLMLDNGQTWRELNKSGFVSMEVGDEVTITRAALGSFMMSVPDGRPIRVRRVK